MSRLNLHCELCGRRQADGLLSRAAWGEVGLGGGSVLRACPNCKAAHHDWESRLLDVMNGSGAGVREPGNLSA